MRREIITNGAFVKNIKESFLNSKLTEKSVSNIVGNSYEILNKCVDPSSSVSISNTGIIIGRIQSGKTANFIATIAASFDNGFNIAVVLTGNKDDLTKQTYDRISETFKELDDKVVVIYNKINEELMNANEVYNFLDLGKKVIFVMLKNVKNINKVQEIFNDYRISSQPTIIIDDEGDQASLDNNATKVDLPETATYKAINDLRNEITVHSFLAVTATPYPNLLLDQSSLLSPDFFHLVYPGDGYCGLSTFHGLDSEKYIRAIPANDLYDNEMPDTLVESINVFFLACAIDKYNFKAKNAKEEKKQMLVHTDYKKMPQADIKEKILERINYIRMTISDSKDISYKNFIEELENLFNKEYRDSFRNIEFLDLEECIVSSIKDLGVILVVSDNQETSLENSKHMNTIVVGGNKVERGVTFDRLLVTFFTRTAKGKSTLDNTEQRARWLGYREKYLDLCRVYASEKIIDQFRYIYDTEEDLWSLLLDFGMDRNYKELEIYIINNCSTLIPTRKTVAKTAINSFNLRSASQRRIILNNEVADFNMELIKSIKSKLNCEPGLNQMRKFEITRDYDLIRFIDDISEYKFYKNEDFLSKLNVLKENKHLKEKGYKIDILWMDLNLETGIREVKPDGTVVQLFVGRRKGYEGDRNLGNLYSPDKPQLQVHFIKPRDENFNFYSPVLAMLIPDNIEQTNDIFVTRG